MIKNKNHQVKVIQSLGKKSDHINVGLEVGHKYVGSNCIREQMLLFVCIQASNFSKLCR